MSVQRQRILRHILLHKTPAALAWTATSGRPGHVSAVVGQKWHIKVSGSRLYQLFEQWGLSLQKAHRDYGPQEQAHRSPT
ncbi:MAG: hypothetical protein Q8N96_15150 [Methylovulum sp.]|nr:hypothetical protein [Methylovulum sp.]